MCATLAKDVVFPVPLIQGIKLEMVVLVPFFINFSKRSISPAHQNVQICKIKLSFTNFSISFYNFRANQFFKIIFDGIITLIATSDSKSEISNSKRISSMSFSLSSFSPKLFAKNALKVYQTSFIPIWRLTAAWIDWLVLYLALIFEHLVFLQYLVTISISLILFQDN